MHQPADVRSATVVVDDGLAVTIRVDAVEVDRVGRAVDYLHRAERRADRVRRAGVHRRIEVDPDTIGCIVAGGCQADHRGADTDDEVLVFMGQPADAVAAAMAVEHPLPGGKAVGVAEVDRVDGRERRIGHGDARSDRQP